MQHDSDDVSQVGLGIEVVQLARGDKGEKICGGMAVVVARAEQSLLASSSHNAKSALRAILVKGQPRIDKEAFRLSTLFGYVANRFAHFA